MSTPRHSVSVAAVITDHEGRALVIRRRDNGDWQLTGGILELDEDIHDGLRREIREETGVEIQPGPLTGVYKNMNLGVVALVFRATVASGQPRPTDEAADIAWWTAEQVKTGMTPAFGIRILDALQPGTPAIRHHDGTNLL